MDYVRTRELPMVLDLIDESRLPAECRVLDIASPQILSIHLAKIRPDWKITYVNPFRPELDEMHRLAKAVHASTIVTLTGDARDRRLFPPASFDLVLSSSVLEHVGDLDGEHGDTTVMRNAGIWLRPSGQMVLSVPFSRKAFDEYTDAPVYGESQRVGGRCFFQRFYDQETFNSRLVCSTGLSPQAHRYLGERWFHENDPHTRLAGWLARRRVRFLLGRVYPWLACIFLQSGASHSELRKPYIAAMRCVKP